MCRDHPLVIAYCLSCEKPDCPDGECEEVKAYIAERKTRNCTHVRHVVEWRGMKLSLSEFAEDVGISRTDAYTRIVRQHMSPERAAVACRKRSPNKDPTE